MEKRCCFKAFGSSFNNNFIGTRTRSYLTVSLRNTKESEILLWHLIYAAGSVHCVPLAAGGPEDIPPTWPQNNSRIFIVPVHLVHPDYNRH